MPVTATSDYGDWEADQADFPKQVAGLLPGEVRYVLDPKTSFDPETLEPIPLYDMILALGDEERAIGYIGAKVRSQPIDRLLHVSPRLHKGKLFIAEIDPENEERNGMILYDDQTEASFSTRRLATDRLDLLYPAPYELAQRELFGFVDSPDERVRIYYLEFLPYPDQLLVWVLGIQVDLDELSAPFSRVRTVILAVGLLALVSSLILARIGARRVAMPISDLATKLSEFSQGSLSRVVEIQGPDEIREAATAFNDMAANVERTERERDQAKTQMLQKAKLACIGQLAAGICHEIHNPLHNILALTKLMNRHHSKEDKELLEDIASVHEEAERASRIVRTLLDFSREAPLEYRQFELGPWLAETLSLVATEAKRRGVELTHELEEGYLLEADPNLLQQALINLLLNGLQASDPGGKIRVTATLKDTNLVIEVHDQGSGIEPEIQDRIFDPFFTTKTASKGSGLGLSISLGIVTQHRGELSIHNRPGGGARAVMVLPRARAIRPAFVKVAGLG